MTRQPASAAQERNLELGRRLREIYERGGPWEVDEHFDEFFHPDYVWKPAVSQLGDEVYTGREGYRKWISDMETVATEFTQTDIELRVVGERHLLALGRMRLVGKESGAPSESEYGALYELKDGRAKAGSAFLSHAEAEAAAQEATGDAADA